MLQLGAARGGIANQTGGDRGEGATNFMGVSRAITNDSLQDRDGIYSITGGGGDPKDAYSVSQNYCNVFYFPLVRTISQPIHIRFFWFLFRSKGVLPDY